MITVQFATLEDKPPSCRVYWGTHGCDLPRGHDGPHRCSCADDPDIDPETREYRSEPGVFNFGAPPYYGPDTHFYGEDVPASDGACHSEPELQATERPPEDRQEVEMGRSGPWTEEGAGTAIDLAREIAMPGSSAQRKVRSPGEGEVELDAEIGNQPITELRVVVSGQGPNLRFVELEDQHGKGVGFFEWIHDDPTYAAELSYLRIPVRPWQSFNERQFVEQAQQVMTLQGDLGHLRLAIANARPLLEALIGLIRQDKKLPKVAASLASLSTADAELLQALLEQPGGEMAPANKARIENGALRAETSRQHTRIAELQGELRGAEIARETAQATCDARTDMLKHRTDQVRELQGHVRVLIRNLDGSDGMPAAWWLEAARAVFALEALTEPAGESPRDDGERP